MSALRGITPYNAQAEILDAITPAMALLAGAKIKLLKEPLLLTESTTLAQCDAAEADYTGYAEQIVTAWQAAAKGDDGLISADGIALQFLASGTVASNTIYGAYLVDTTEMILLQLYTLPVPTVLGVDLLQAVDIQPSVTFAQ